MTSIESGSPSGESAREPVPGLLDGRQTAVTAGLALALWFAAAMGIRFGVPAGLYEGAARGVLFAASIPGAVLLNVVIWRTARLRVDQYGTAVLLAIGVATVADGVALTWLPTLYGSEGAPAALLAGAAWLLWGVGAGCLHAV